MVSAELDKCEKQNLLQLLKYEQLMNSTIKLIMINKKIIAYSSFWKILIVLMLY